MKHCWLFVMWVAGMVSDCDCTEDVGCEFAECCYIVVGNAWVKALNKEG